MPDSSLTIDYTIASITNADDGYTTINWSMTFVGYSLGTTYTLSRTGDKFKTSDLALGVETTTDTPEAKRETLRTNFERVALAYFQAFAKTVRAGLAKDDLAFLDDETGDVEGLSTSPKISGSVVID